MNETFQCGDNPALVTYLYGEYEPPEQAVIKAHVAMCAACAAELAALESTRVQLASWTISRPQAHVGRVLVDPAAQAGPKGPALRDVRSLSRGAFPAWLQVAAAAVIFAAGLALGVIRGTQPTSRPAAAGTGDAASAVQAPAVSAADLSALEQRLRDEIAQVRLKPDTTMNSEPGARSVRLQPDVESQLMARVRTLIEESEQRQHRELALRTAQIFRDFDSQRRVDLEQIHRSVGQIEGQTGAEVREQRQMLNYLMRVSQQP